MNYPKILTLGLHFKDVRTRVRAVNRTYEILSLQLDGKVSSLKEEENILFLLVRDHPKHAKYVEEILEIFPCLPLLVLPSSFELEQFEDVFKNILVGMCSAFSNQSFPKLPSIELQKVVGSGADIYVQFLGNFKVNVFQNQFLKLKGNLFTNLMAYLFYNHSQKIHQDKLIRMFWEGFEPDAAKRCLRVHIFNIKKQLKEKFEIKNPILNESGFYFFHPDISIQTDVDLFNENYKIGRQHLRQGDKDQAKLFFEKAKELYRGDFKEGNLREDWFIFERKKWRDRYLEVLHLLAKFFYEEGNFQMAKDYCLIILEQDNCYELAHNLLIQVYVELGQRGMALRQYKVCESILKKELEMKPSIETVELLNKLKLI